MPTSLLRAGPLAADFVSGTNRPTFAVRNGHRVAVFPDSGITETFYTFNMPTVYANGDVNIRLTWMAEVAIGGDCVWEVAFERHEPGVDDLDSPSFAAGVAFVDAADVTPGVPTETVIPINASQMDSVVNGDQFRLAVRRLGDDSSQTMSGNAQLMTVVIDQDADPAGGGGGGFWTDGDGTRAGIGKGSPAPTAIGLESLAHGTSATAGGDSSLGFFGTAEGERSIAMGLGSDVPLGADNGIAIGYNASVALTGDVSAVVIGDTAEGRGSHTVAIGTQAQAGDTAEDFCVAIGYQAIAGRDGAVAIGKNAAAYKDDSIAIGRDVYLYKDYDMIGIGSDITIGATLNCSEAIAIGNLIEIDDSPEAIAIGNELGKGILAPLGTNTIVIGRDVQNNGSALNTQWYSNVVIKGGNSAFSGLYSSTGSAYIGTNICITSDSNSGMKNFNNNYQYRNVLIGTNRIYIYGHSHQNVAIGGYAIDLGDINNQTDENIRNVAIGGGGLGYFNQGGEVTRNNVMIGWRNNMGTGVESCVLMGYDSSSYAGFGANYHYARGNISIGQYCKTGPGIGNVAMGRSCEVFTLGSQYTSYYWNSGNFAVGVSCEINRAGSGGFRATMAQGISCAPVVSGQRAWSADSNSGLIPTNPNQGSFIIPKIETTDATQTAILTFPTKADKAYGFTGFIIARRTDADGFNAVFSLSNSLVYRNAAGAPVLIGDPKPWVLDANQGAPAWAIDITIVGNDILVRVTGTVAQTIEWLGWIQVIEVRG